jgi:hypothetical protein
MGQLKHYTNDDTRNTDGKYVKKQDQPKTMEERRNDKSQGKEKRLAANKPDEIPEFWPANPSRADFTQNHVPKIIVEMPLNYIQTVEWPKIEMLEPMKP